MAAAASWAVTAVASEAPLLFWSLLGLLAACSVCSRHLLPLVLLLGLAAGYCRASWVRLWQVLLLAVVSCGYTAARVCCLHLAAPLPGRGTFEVRKIDVVASFFAPSWRIEGIFSRFESSAGRRYRQLPATILLPIQRPRPAAGRYLLTGRYCAPRHLHYRFIVDGSWDRCQRVYWWREQRIQRKLAIGRWIRSQLGTSTTSALLQALAVGHLSCYTTKLFFLRLGLLPLLAISGFHYALLAAVLLRLTAFITDYRCRHGLIVLLLTLYLGAIGTSASSLRAWLFAVVFFLSRSSLRRFSPLNTLGLALAIELLVNPFCFVQLGFQLSFAATGSILLFAAPIGRRLEWLWPLPPPAKRESWGLASYGLLLLIQQLRQMMAVTLAAQLAALPLLADIAPRFCPLALLYPLWVVPAIGATFLLLILALLTAATPLGGLLLRLIAAGSCLWLPTIEEVPNCLLISISWPDSCAAARWLLLVVLFASGGYRQALACDFSPQRLGWEDDGRLQGDYDF